MVSCLCVPHDHLLSLEEARPAEFNVSKKIQWRVDVDKDLNSNGLTDVYIQHFFCELLPRAT